MHSRSLLSFATSILRLWTVYIVVSVLAVCGQAQGQAFRDAKALQALPASIQRWYEFESKFLSRSVKPGLFSSINQNSQDRRYTPDEANVFELHGYWIPADELKIFESDFTQELKQLFVRTRNGKAEVLLLVHPETERFYQDLNLNKNESEIFLAAATASSRSLLVWKESSPQTPFIAKVSLDARVADTNRLISEKETAMSVGVDKILHRMGDLPKSFTYMPEAFGVIPKRYQRGGMIIRAIPKISPDHTLVPYFSLYSDANGTQQPLLTKMIARSKLEPREFVMRKIVEPFLDQWLSLVIDNGITMEPHGQNILLEIDRHGDPTGRIVHRDFGGFNPDLDFIERKYGIKKSELPHVSTSVMNDYYQEAHTRMIRHSLGTYFGDALLFNIGAKWTEWKKRGYLHESKDSAFDVKFEMIRLLDKKLSARTGRSIVLHSHLEGLENVIRTLRQPSPARSCSVVF